MDMNNAKGIQNISFKDKKNCYIIPIIWHIFIDPSNRLIAALLHYWCVNKYHMLNVEYAPIFIVCRCKKGDV